jgi:MoxR-like ATPase
LPRPFLIIATQNLIETHGTFSLPISQLDRFMVSMTLGLPTPEEELEILVRWERGQRQVRPVLTPAEVIEMQQAVLRVQVAQPVKQYLANLAAASRKRSSIYVGVSPRGVTALLRACQAWAAFAGRTFVLPEDVHELAPYVWGHRVLIVSGEDVRSGREAVVQLLNEVAVPVGPGRPLFKENRIR